MPTFFCAFAIVDLANSHAFAIHSPIDFTVLALILAYVFVSIFSFFPILSLSLTLSFPLYVLIAVIRSSFRFYTKNVSDLFEGIRQVLFRFQRSIDKSSKLFNRTVQICDNFDKLVM